MRQFLKRCLLLNKRLYKKLSFLILMICIPLLALAFSAAANTQSGFVTVALAGEDPADPLSCQLMEEFMNQDSLIRFMAVNTPQDAALAVKQGQADAAWIFKANTTEHLRNFGENPQSAVTVIEREQNVFTRIAREKLSAVLFPYCAKGQYLHYIRTNLPGLSEKEDGQLLEIYDAVTISEELFTFQDGQGMNTQNTNYLTAPIRGLLSVFLTVACAAATLFWMQDEKEGTFAYAKGAFIRALPFLSVFLAALNLLAVTLITLFACGLQVGFLRELTAGVGLCLCSAVFCLFLKNLLQSLKVYAAATVPLCLALLVFCPVFLDFKRFWFIQLLFPNTYYLNGITKPTYLGYMLVYCLVLGMGYVALGWKKQKN